MRTIQISFLFLLTFCAHVYGQRSKTASPKHIVKLGITPIVVGEILPSYEYVFTDKFGLEAGIGFVTENYLNQFIQESNFGNTRLMKLGPSFLIAARYYPFRRADYIENFNKKHLYLLIREMTDCKTHYITKVVNVMKKHQKKMLNDYLHHGELIVDKKETFWEDDRYIDTDYL